LDTFGKIDSKYRFVIVASKRAKQLLRGAKPKIKAKTKNPIRLAQLEVREGVVEFDILHTDQEDFLETGEQVFTASDLEEVDDHGGGAGADADEVETEEGVLETEEGSSFEEDLPDMETVEEKDEG
jgi:DNA-directed RNA polymerase omega subunit